MGKALIFIVLLALSILAAALFGAVHNQVSYAVAPEYFHGFKFRQFGIKTELHGPEGASIVGVLASWWMGLVVGVPVLLLALFIPGKWRYARTGLVAIAIVIVAAATCALAGLCFAYVFMTPDLAAMLNLPDTLDDPVVFARAGAMHEGSYLGGAVGLFVALYYVWRARKHAVRDRTARQ